MYTHPPSVLILTINKDPVSDSFSPYSLELIGQNKPVTQQYFSLTTNQHQRQGLYHILVYCGKPVQLNTPTPHTPKKKERKNILMIKLFKHALLVDGKDLSSTVGFLQKRMRI
jgi:hypothetical protein